MTTRIVCHGYQDADERRIPCGKILGEKEGPDGDSHTYCDDCFQKQMDAASEYLKAMESFAVSGTLDNGDSKRMKVLRVQAIALGKSAYESTG